MDAITERVLPGSAVHVQWREDDNAWRCLTLADAESDRRSSAAPVGWRPWTGDPVDMMRLAVVRGRERWWVVTGELPSGGSAVVVETANGTRPTIAYLAGRIWYAEWLGAPSTASITIDDREPIRLDYRRKAHYLPDDSPRPATDGPRRGWTSRSRPSDHRDDPAS